MREMKDSGVDWIGKIPEHWKISKNKYFLTMNSGDNIDTNFINNIGLYPVYGGNGLRGYLNRYNYEGEFLLIGRQGALSGNVHKVCNKFWATEHALVGTLIKKINFNYLYYVLDAENLNQYAFETAAQPGISISKIGNVNLPVPPLAEQQAIAAFLDKKCGQIDKLSEKLQGEIEKLQEYKKSLISETVTQGLDKNVAMKDSGVDWIGKIPKHWEMHPTYVYFEEHKNINYRGKENNLLSLSYGKIIRKDINTNGGLLPENFNGYNIVEKDNIVFRLTDLQNDKKSLRTGLVTEKGIITSAYITLQKKGDIHVPFYNYLYHSYDVKKVFYNMGGGVRQGLNYAELSKLMLVNPPLSEQQAIAAFLDDKCSQLDAVIAKKQQQVSILADYKKSLIYEYVTGKKEVTADEVH